MYYKDKVDTLKTIFGSENVSIEDDYIIVDGQRYPVVSDVIILSFPEQYTEIIKSRIAYKANVVSDAASGDGEGFAEDIQFTFGQEWQKYDTVLDEHKKEFFQYFDIVDLEGLKTQRVCDLGCGNGRWSYFLKDRCSELILVDFSDAIFVARKNLAQNNNCLFFMCDLRKLPFKADFADFILCLGVLHHLPTPCLDEVRNLKGFARQLLIFLYYALDNRPAYFQFLLKIVTIIRLALCKIRIQVLRNLISKAGTFFIYIPLIYLGHMLRPFNLGKYVPLYEFYRNKSVKRIEQDVYDRFFTRIEQRVTRKDILALKSDFKTIKVSDSLPYWHFLCEV